MSTLALSYELNYNFTVTAESSYAKWTVNILLEVFFYFLGLTSRNDKANIINVTRITLFLFLLGPNFKYIEQQDPSYFSKLSKQSN